jgi:hypothetical protein
LGWGTDWGAKPAGRQPGSHRLQPSWSGTIGAICSLPLRMYPWVMSDMVDPKEAQEFICKDFVEKTLKLMPPFSMEFARRLTLITVPLLTEIGCIPVYRKSDKIEFTWQKSLDLLLEKKYIFVTPEYEKADMDPVTKMQPFMTGFIQLGEVYHQATKRVLYFYPVAVHESRHVIIGKQIGYDPLNSLEHERERLSRYLERSIATMYLELKAHSLHERIPFLLHR